MILDSPDNLATIRLAGQGAGFVTSAYVPVEGGGHGGHLNFQRIEYPELFCDLRPILCSKKFRDGGASSDEVILVTIFRYLP